MGANLTPTLNKFVNILYILINQIVIRSGKSKAFKSMDGTYKFLSKNYDHYDLIINDSCITQFAIP
jgi:hypothetical protein